jgi:hypothetical protein
VAIKMVARPVKQTCRRRGISLGELLYYHGGAVILAIFRKMDIREDMRR